MSKHVTVEIKISVEDTCDRCRKACVYTKTLEGTEALAEYGMNHPAAQTLSAYYELSKESEMRWFNETRLCSACIEALRVFARTPV